MEVIISGGSPTGKLLKKLKKGVDDVWDEMEKDLKTNIQHGAQPYYNTGTMKRNIYTRKIPNGIEGGIEPSGLLVNWRGKRVAYPAFIIYGTKAHIIKPKRKKALRWVGKGGKFAYSKGHMVSGIKANNFILKAGEKTLDDTYARLKQKFK